MIAEPSNNFSPDTSGLLLVQSFYGHNNKIHQIVWHPTEQTIVSVADDGTARLWHCEPPPKAPPTSTIVLLPAKPHTIVWSPDGTHIVTGTNDALISIWDYPSLQQTQCLRGHTGSIFSVDWSRTMPLIASASRDATVKVWDVSRLHDYPYTLGGNCGWAFNVVWSPDGTTLAYGSENEIIYLWHAPSKTMRHMYTEHTNFILCVVWSPDGTMIASGSYDATVQLWDVAHGTLLVTLHTPGGIGHVAFSPDGKHLAATAITGVTMIWRIAVPDEQHPIICVDPLATITEGVYAHYANSVAFHPHQHMLATTGFHVTLGYGVYVWRYDV